MMKRLIYLPLLGCLLFACKNDPGNRKKAPIPEEYTANRLEGVMETAEEKAARMKRDAIDEYLAAKSSFENAGSAADATTKEAILSYKEKLVRYKSAASTLAGKTDSISKAADADFKKLKARESADYSKLRANYGKWANAEAWENDMKVKVSGTTIRFIHHSFVSNKNIKSAFETLESILRDLKFKQVRFEWYEGSEYTYYTLD